SDRVRISSVDVDFFDAFRIPVIAGRTFRSDDVGATSGVVIINESLAHNIGGNPVGVRLRTVSADEEQERGPWLEVAGGGENLDLDPTAHGDSDFMFMPASVATLSGPPYVAVRVSGDSRAFEQKLRMIAAQVAPDLRLYDVLPLTEVIRRDNADGVLMATIGVSVVVIVLLLSAAGLFALMSVAVARRTREIGIRRAIGASPRAVLTALFKRAATQIAGGIVIGNLLVLM